MPRYVSITPTFNPISVDEYLKVPMLLAKEYAAEEEKVENYKDRLSYIRAIMGDKGKGIFDEYDNIMNTISDNPSLSNITEQGKRLRELYRDIGSRVEVAKANRDRYQTMFDKNPSLIGEVGSLYDYYQNPDYRPNIIDGSQLEAKAGELTSEFAKTILPTPTGRYMGNPANKQAEYMYGISPAQLGQHFKNIIDRTPDSAYEQSIIDLLDSVGYEQLPSAQQKAVRNQVAKGMQNNSGFKTGIVNELAFDNTKSLIANRASGGSGSGSGKNKLTFTGTVSSRPPKVTNKVVNNPTLETDATGKTKKVDHYTTVPTPESASETVNKTNATLPTNAARISVEDAKTYMKDQFYNVFANNKVDGKESINNIDKYDLYVVPDANLPGLAATIYGTLYVVPKGTSSTGTSSKSAKQSAVNTGL